MSIPRKIKNIKFLIVPHLLTIKIRAPDFIYILPSTAILSHLIKDSICLKQGQNIIKL